MAKTLFYRLFGLGKMPQQFLTTLNSEGLLLLDEGIKGSLTYRDFRAPGKRSGWQRVWFSSCVAITNGRLFALHNSNPAINVPFSDERIRKMQFSIEGDETLLVAFDAGLFHSDWSGSLEYRFRTPEAKAFLELLSKSVSNQKT
jgi:hypothetical protein